MIFAPIWSIGDWRVHKEATISFGSCSYPTQKLQTGKEAAWKCYTTAPEEISISTATVGRIYWLYGADANYDQHGDVVTYKQGRPGIKISIFRVTSHLCCWDSSKHISSKDHVCSLSVSTGIYASPLWFKRPMKDIGWFYQKLIMSWKAINQWSISQWNYFNFK